jgi:hypothetical protein
MFANRQIVDENVTNAVNLPDPDETNVSSDDLVQICTHECQDYAVPAEILDIFKRASSAVKNWEMGTTPKQTKAEVLEPYVEEYNRIDLLETEDVRRINFSTAQKLDREFFNTHRNGHWRNAFKNPAIGKVLHSTDFRYRVPVCGLVVTDHGILTMCIVLNDPIVLRVVQQQRELMLEHEKDCPDSNEDPVVTLELLKPRTHCINFAKKMQELENEFQEASDRHENELYTESDSDPEL